MSKILLTHGMSTKIHTFSLYKKAQKFVWNFEFYFIVLIYLFFILIYLYLSCDVFQEILLSMSAMLK